VPTFDNRLDDVGGQVADAQNAANVFVAELEPTGDL
jgi:hypothetical protein